MAKNADERPAKRDYLIGLVKAEKVITPTEAHKALKDKFGGSLTFGEVSRILGKWGHGPKRPRRAAKRGGNAKAPARPAGAARRKGGGARPGRTGKTAANHKYAILGPGNAWQFAGDRAEMTSKVERLIAQGASAAAVSVYDLVPRKMRVQISF